MRMFALTTLFVCLLFVGCSEKSEKESVPGNTSKIEYPHICFWEDYRHIGDDNWYVCYGTCWDSENSIDKLIFVFFEGGPVETRPGIRRVVARDDRRADGVSIQEGWLIDDVASGREMIQLPTEAQLYEVQDGELVTSDQRVTLDKIKRFIDSKPKRYTVSALLGYGK